MITRHRLKGGEITEFVMEGPSDVDEMVNVISKEYPSVTKNVLWDLSAGDVSSFTNENFQQVANAAKAHSKHEKTAFVGDSPFIYGILRMYKAYSEMAGVPLKMNVFGNRDEAIKWLNE